MPKNLQKVPTISEGYLTHNEQGIKVLFGKRYRWTKDGPREPLRLVPAEPEKTEQAIEIPQALVRRAGGGERA